MVGYGSLTKVVILKPQMSKCNRHNYMWIKYNDGVISTSYFDIYYFLIIDMEITKNCVECYFRNNDGNIKIWCGKIIPKM